MSGTAGATPAKKKLKQRAFYEPPENVVTSAQIIREARETLRTLPTARPFTPSTPSRVLFSSAERRGSAAEARPPSVFSLDSRHFESESRPVSGRLSPLEKPPLPSAEEIEAGFRPAPPKDERPSSRRKSGGRLVRSRDLDDEANHQSIKRSGSLVEISHSESPESDVRRVKSGPKDKSPRDPQPPKEPSSTRIDSGYRSADPALRSEPVSSADEAILSSDWWIKTVNPLIKSLGERPDATLVPIYIKTVNQLYGELKERHLLTKNCPNRSEILKMVFRLLDNESPLLQLTLAKLALGLRVTKKNLTNICKLAFKISRSEDNDTVFIQNMEVFGYIHQLCFELTPAENYEALVYCCGTLKFLSANSAINKEISKQGCLDAMKAILEKINEMQFEPESRRAEAEHILIQLSATLRNLADNNSNRKWLTRSGIIGQLVQLLDRHYRCSELMLNIARILSKLTMQEDVCQLLTEQETFYRSMFRILELHRGKEDIVVRVCFILGNITALIDSARAQLMAEKNSIQYLLETFLHYLKAYRKAHKDEAKSSEPITKTYEDVLVKLIRLIANISIHSKAGPKIAKEDLCLQYLIKVLEYFNVSKSEEIVMNSLATINNIAYWGQRESNSAVVKLRVSLASRLFDLLFVDNPVVLTEVFRALGNLSQAREIRDLIMKQKVGQMLVMLLDSGNRELVFNVIGVLINVTADEDKRTLLKEDGGVRKLIEVLRDFGQDDWQLAGLVCQSLWNYSSKITSSTHCFGVDEAQMLSDILAHYLDDTAVSNPNENGELPQNIRASWETNFCGVATLLLERIESHQSDLLPL